MKVAVVGGGPAGLATLKFLSHAHEYFPISPIEVRLFESEKDIGGTFSYRVYEDAELVSSKYLTAFSDFRLPEEAPDFLTPGLYVKYLKEYASTFELWGMVELHTRVDQIRRGPNGVGHIVSLHCKDTGRLTEWTCDAVAVCTGINVNPIIPDIKGVERIPSVLHSSQLKTRAQFGDNTNVYIMGTGETGMDLAYLAIIPIPKVMGHSKEDSSGRPNKPVDTSVASLFDTAYVHPKLQRSQLLWTYYDRWVKKMHWVISGTEEGPDQWVGQMSTSRKYLDSSKSPRSTDSDLMNVGKRSTSWVNRMRSRIINVPLRNNDGKKIDVVTWPKSIDENGLVVLGKKLRSDSVLPDEQLKPDVMVFATGYTREFPFLNNDYPCVSQTNVRGVYKDGDVSLGFIGFVRPAIGAIPPLAELQAQFWVLRLLQDQFPKEVPRQLGPNSLPSYDLDYQLHPRGSYNFFETKRAVDHESYAYQLALDMGSAPTATYVFKKGFRLFLTWAMGSNFNTKFRLVGPWQWEEGAENIMRNELYRVVKRSGGCGRPDNLYYNPHVHLWSSELDVVWVFWPLQPRFWFGETNQQEAVCRYTCGETGVENRS